MMLNEEAGGDETPGQVKAAAHAEPTDCTDVTTKVPVSASENGVTASAKAKRVLPFWVGAINCGTGFALLLKPKRSPLMKVSFHYN